MKVLAGDIGGTKTSLGLFEVEEQAGHYQVKPVYAQTWPSAEYQSLEEIILHFLEALTKQNLRVTLKNAAFGIAGPVHKNRCQVTNLPWMVDAQALSRAFGLQVALLNDLEANARGIVALTEQDFVILNRGVEVQANASIIAAGTGLGEAGMFWDGKRHIPFASEGGHTEFSPANEKEYRLCEFLYQKYPQHVSWERVVSGMGLENIYQFLCYDQGVKPPLWLAEAMQAGDAAAKISTAAMVGKDPLCEQALDWLVYFYGVEAGNQALKIMSRGGVFLGGGIAPKIIKQLQSGRFMEGFTRKGRMSHLLEAMPVKVIMNDKTALYGPAIYAAENRINDE